jgi:hypothetical protein
MDNTKASKKSKEASAQGLHFSWRDTVIEAVERVYSLL